MQLIDKILLNESNTIKKCFGIQKNHQEKFIVDTRVVTSIKPTRFYFFLQQEIDACITPANRRKHARKGIIRHLTITSDGLWYDYIVHQHYNSIFDWAEDCGSNIKDVLFGKNHAYIPDGEIIYITLLDLLTHLKGKDNWDYYLNADKDYSLEKVEQKTTPYVKIIFAMFYIYVAYYLLTRYRV